MREPTNLSLDTSRNRIDARPRPPATDGLGRLDEDRALSLADEGGVSAAALESQECLESWDLERAGQAVALFALVGLAFWGIQRAFRS